MSRACILFLFLLILTDVRATGLSTSFVDVVVLDVPLGKPRRVEDREGNSLVIWNTGDTPVIVHAEALKPSDQELRPPAESIKDLRWIIIEPSSLTLGPHETGRFDVALSLPPDSRLRHRIFQAMIWSRSEPVQGGGVSLSAGLKSRLRFRTEK
jgi:hypothetical protein